MVVVEVNQGCFSPNDVERLARERHLAGGRRTLWTHHTLISFKDS